MKIIRVFVSSPGDVKAERSIADRLLRSTAEEFGVPASVQYSNLLREERSPLLPGTKATDDDIVLCPYFWEYQRFSSDNKAEFEKGPAKYVPQYGAFCAYGVTLGVLADPEVPDAFLVYKGKLYLAEIRGP